MTTNTTTTLSDSVRTQYLSDYIIGVGGARIYDMFAYWPIGKTQAELEKGTSFTLNFIGDLPLGTSTVSEVNDIAPVGFEDATATITPTSRGLAVQDSELILLRNYLNYSGDAGAKMRKLGKNNMLSVDLLAQAAATQGSNIKRAAARASLDAGTQGHRLTDSSFSAAESRFSTLKVPSFLDAMGLRVDNAPGYMAVMANAPYHDLRTSGNIDDISFYQDKDIILNMALGRIGPFQIVVSPWAKVFWGAGADNASSIATTLDGATLPLAKTIVVAANTNIDVGDYLNIGTEETGDTHYPTNERVWVSSVAGTTIGVIGEADNGGLLYAHDSGVDVRNADSVYTVVYGGATSLAKLYATQYVADPGRKMTEGPFGAVLGPRASGNLDQFVTVGWKFYGGYSRWNESWILRQEVAVSEEA